VGTLKQVELTHRQKCNRHCKQNTVKRTVSFDKWASAT